MTRDEHFPTDHKTLRTRVKAAGISAVITIVIIIVALGVWLREPLYMIYKTRNYFAEKETTLLYYAKHKGLATELRRFAEEQRWGRADKSPEPDFYYGDDPKLPALVRAVHPSWVQISDDRIDLGCGDVTWIGSRSFGISVWRTGIEGWGAKKLGEGVWFYSDTSESLSQDERNDG